MLFDNNLKNKITLFNTASLFSTCDATILYLVDENGRNERN